MLEVGLAAIRIGAMRRHLLEIVARREKLPGCSNDDRPDGVIVSSAIERFLEREVVPRLDGVPKFHARVAANVVAMVAREIETADAHERGEWLRLGELLVQRNERDPVILLPRGIERLGPLHHRRQVRAALLERGRGLEAREDLEEMGEELEEWSEDEKEEEEREKVQAMTLEQLSSNIRQLLEDVEGLKKKKK